jgi:hypothetical protein
MDLSVILVTHNSERFILPCLDSIVRTTYGIEHEILIIDNYSTDRTKDLIKASGHSLALTENLENQGLTKAANMGLRMSSGEFRLLINPDVTIQSSSLTSIIDFMRGNPRAGICGCGLLNKDGTRQYSKGPFPNLVSMFFRMVLPRQMRKYHLSGYQRTGECDWVTGAFMLVRDRVIQEIGYLDEEYFMYYEDVDYCLKANRAGWQTYYYPEIAVCHLTPHAISDKGDRIRKEIRKSRLFYFKKNGSWLSYFVLRVCTDHWR